jgi:hypothetical protein
VKGATVSALGIRIANVLQDREHQDRREQEMSAATRVEGGPRMRMPITEHGGISGRPIRWPARGAAALFGQVGIVEVRFGVRFTFITEQRFGGVAIEFPGDRIYNAAAASQPMARATYSTLVDLNATRLPR